MTPLRKSMIEAMQLRGFSARTHQSYLDAVTKLAQHYRCSPDKLTHEQLQAFFNHLALERGLSPASCRLYLNAIRFLYLQVLQWPHFDVPLVVPKRTQRIPELLTQSEVRTILGSLTNPKHRMLLALCYGCGLRVSELVQLRVSDIDGERSLLRITQGKGAKDRLVLLAPTLLKQLRHYWQAERPQRWLFPNEHQWEQHISISTAQRVFLRAKDRAGVRKIGGIHSLRHAYATHQLESGLPVHQLQRLLGHSNLQSTMRYVHWVPDKQRNASHADLIAVLGVEDE